MPEIGEVARIVQFLRKHIVGKTLAVVKAQHDENVFGKVGTSAAEFEKALKGKRVLDAQQQGKYFWLEMSSPPHPLMHFGMAGVGLFGALSTLFTLFLESTPEAYSWLKIRNENTAYYKSDNTQSDSEWPPKYWKFILETAEEPKAEAAFVDSRRFAKIRLIDCRADDLRNTTPLKENGPDPVIDGDIVTVEWLKQKLGSKRIPIKALLLDQANISGIGNWVGDELLYNARIHPEQYSNTLSDEQIIQIHKSIHYVCGLAVKTLADPSKFPEEWLFKYRWQKGKKGADLTLGDGTKFVYLTVGGRTSAVVPSVQKKTGPVAKDIDEKGEEVETKKGGKKRKATPREESEDEDQDAGTKPAAKTSRGKKAAPKEESEGEDQSAASKPVTKKGRGKKAATKNEEGEADEKLANGEAHEEVQDEAEVAEKPLNKKQKSEQKITATEVPESKKAKSAGLKEETGGRRKSGRARGKEVSYAED